MPAENAASPRHRVIDRQARRIVLAKLARLNRGRLQFVEPDWSEVFGDDASHLKATVYVDDPASYRQFLMRGGLGAAETYIDGGWHTDDLSALIRIMAVNQIGSRNRGFANLARPSLALFRARHRNTLAGSRRNVAAHYDLGDSFFELFLDPSLTYSSGIFEHPDATMEEASMAKHERVCRKLLVSANDHILEIGGGWGSFAIYAAEHYGCRVTTTTISQSQFERCRARVAEAGLGDRVEVLNRDYRELGGVFDKLVSIEMIEAVGHAHLDTYFRCCGNLLAPNGAMLVQSITVPDQRLRAYLRGVDFISRHIFPGGQLVSLGSMNGAATRASDLRVTHLEDLTPHYAETLRRWRNRLCENREAVLALVHDEEFFRSWEFYLAYCEGAFEERQIGVAQLLFEKPATRRDSLLGTLGSPRRLRHITVPRETRGASDY